MASTTQTTNYGLPIYSQNDKASWVDTNEGFSALDTDLHTAKTTAESASGQATTNAENITDLQGRMTSAEGSLTTLTGTTLPAMQAEIDSAETALGTSYSNSDSDLESNTVQGAIDELTESRNGNVIATVSADGVMTMGTMLHTLYDTLQNLTEDEFYRTELRTKFTSGDNPRSYVLRPLYYSNTGRNYVRTVGNTVNITSDLFILAASLSDCKSFESTVNVNGTPGTGTNSTNDVPTAGSSVFTIIIH